MYVAVGRCNDIPSSVKLGRFGLSALSEYADQPPLVFSKTGTRAAPEYSDGIKGSADCITTRNTAAAIINQHTSHRVHNGVERVLAVGQVHADVVRCLLKTRCRRASREHVDNVTRRSNLSHEVTSQMMNTDPSHVCDLICLCTYVSASCQRVSDGSRERHHIARCALLRYSTDGCARGQVHGLHGAMRAISSHTRTK